MEYVVGPVLALLFSMKFADYRIKKADETIKIYTSRIEMVEKQIIDNNKMMSQQTLKLLTPVVKSVQDINKQLGL